MAKIIAYVEIEVRDKWGQLKSYQKKEANSLVKNFINAMYVNMSNQQLSSVVDTGGVSQTLDCRHAGGTYKGMVYYLAQVDNDASYGIVVGSGSAAVTVLDTKLQTRILSGDIAGTLHYLVETFTTPATAGGTHSFTTSRGFTNNSGAPITVNEVGIYSYTGIISNGANYFCIERTLLTFTIAAGATGTVTYTFQVTV